jgi:exonuclease SbcC
MRITRIDLENVKSYKRGSAAFAEGTNAICGPNGAGKSTLLETVGFALFDYLPTTQSQFVREGEKTATITVHLVDDEGRPYQVVRKCGSSTQYCIYDPELGKLTASKEETVDWLREFMMVEATDDLSALFQDAVGVPQGLLTAVFLDKPSTRRNTFNPLLRVDEYEKAWEALRDSRSWLKEAIDAEQAKIAGFEAEVKSLPGWQEKARELATKVKVDKKCKRGLRAKLKELSQQKRALEALKAQLEEVKQSVTKAEAEVKTLATQLAESQLAVEGAQKAQSIVEETESAHQAYVAAQANLGVLEEQRKERDSFKDARQTHTTDLAVAQQQAERLKSDLETIAEAETELEKLRPQVEKQKRLEDELARTEKSASKLRDREKNLAQERTRLAELEDKLSGVQAGLAESTEVEEQIGSLQGEMESLDEQRNALTSQAAGIQAELEQVNTQTVSLEAAEGAQCPVCEGPLTADHRTELLARNRATQKRLEKRLAKAEAQQQKLEKARKQKQKALRKLEKQAKELPRQAEADSLAEQIEAQEETVKDLEAQVAGLSGAPAEVKRLETLLKTLGNPRRDYERAADTVERRDGVERELGTIEAQVAALEQQIADVEDELKAYADLDKRLKAERKALADHESDHQRYLGHIREAGTLEERQEKVASLEEELKTAQAEYDRLAEEQEQVAAGYDAKAYAKVTKAYEAKREELAALEERLRQQQAQIEEAQAEIERLTKVQADLEAACAEREELDALFTLLEHIRGVLRDAGPKITQALVEVISLQAARLYADIMADHTARLRWTDDYEIVLTTGGRERTFQQLSGGEQMAAALAVRLALLREVSGIDIAFFDEPTANLDDRRRDNLAEQILNVKGFSQLFVISHDDTFERDTDNVVRISKESGVSQVAEA